MEKVYIENAGFCLDICVNGCGGILFDNREFKEFDEQHENIDNIVSAYKSKTYQKVNEDKQRICPVCGASMTKNYASSLHEVEIDECYSCGAQFLDYGELKKIRAQFATEKERSEAYKAKQLEIKPELQSILDYKAKTPDEALGKLFGIKVSDMAEVIKKLL